jgi:N-sulfoglucosamine sulfohydrolase
MKSFITILLLLLYIKAAFAQNKPNIVLFMADDCTYRDIGAYGSEDSKTPNIDRLAENGKKFNNFFQAVPMCSPTRHNLMTGIYPVRSGAYPNHTFVKKGTKSVVQYLKPLGYRVALSGKRHLSPKSVFDFEYLGKGKNPDFELVEKFLADTKNEGQPFCLFLTSNEPHVPWNKGNKDLFDAEKVKLPPTYVDTKETREGFVNYLAEINYLDQQVGKALSLLEKYGMTNNTIFIFTSEQGNSFPFAKYTCYDAGLQTAFIVKWPGVVRSGTTSEAVADYTDVVPTFIEIAGGRVPSALDGKSFLGVLKGETADHKNYSFGIQTTRGIFSGSDHYGIRGVTDGHYRLVMNLTPEAEFTNLATDPQKGRDWWMSWVEAAKRDPFARERVNAHRKRPAIELYDTKADPFHLKNLAGKEEYAEIEAQLKKELVAWMEYCGDEGNKTEMDAMLHQKRNR